MDGPVDIAEVASGYSHTCARDSEGLVWCWGDNLYGAVGENATGELQPTAVLVAGVANAAALGLGWDSSCAVLADGGISCWGSVGGGPTPSPVGLSNAVDIALGEWHTLALDGDGVLWAWGANFRGQLGDGTTQPRDMPGPVDALGSSVATLGAGRYLSCAAQDDDSLWCWGAIDASDGDFFDSKVPVSFPLPCE